jgi:Na+/proline symporter
MSGYQYAYFSMVGFTAIYVVIAIIISREIRSPNAFFHRSKKSDNIISLLVANITLGTGMVYLITGGQNHGLLMLLVPLATFLGYVLLAHTFSKIQVIIKPGQNIIATVQEHLDQIYPTAPVPYAKSVTFCLVIIYTLVLGYELVASPRIIAPFVTANPGPYAEPLIAGFLFLAALFTVMFGGIRGIFRTDWLQLVAIIIVVILLVWITASGTTGSSSAIGSSILKKDLKTLIAIAMACLSAVCTQFYSLLNMATASHLEANNRPTVFRVVGFLTFIILLVLVSCGLVAQSKGQDLTALIIQGYNTIGQSHGVHALFISIFVAFGLTSIICSTADSLMIAITQVVYDNFLKRNSFEETEDLGLIRGIRVSILLTFLFAFIGLLVIFLFRMNLFYLLLTMAAPVTVFAPLCWLFGKLLAADPEGFRVLSRWTLWCYIGLFILSSIIAALMLLFQPELVPYIGLGAFIISSLLSGGLLVKAKRIA